ncbi:GTPase-activating protein [Coemansia sp. RSA 552]|nr:GTPase-activating protein [Coemansia sp. RSA 552]
MATIDAPSGDSPPVKKSLRSKRLMRPAKGKGRKDSSASGDGPAATPPKLDVDGGEFRSGQCKMSLAERSADKEPHTAEGGNDWASPKTGDSNSRNSGTDTETLLAADDSKLSARLPSVDKSASGTSYSSSMDAEVFVEASESQPATATAQRGSFGRPPHGADPAATGAGNQDGQRERSSSLMDAVDLAFTHDRDDGADRTMEAGSARNCSDSADADNDSSGQDFMHMLSGIEEEDPTKPSANGDGGNAAAAAVGHEDSHDSTESCDNGFMDSLVSSYGLANDAPGSAGLQDFPQSRNTTVSASDQPRSATMGDRDTSTGVEKHGDAAKGDRAEDRRAATLASLGKPAPVVSVPELESEHAKLDGMAKSPHDSAREYGVRRSTSLRIGSPSSASPRGRRRPSEGLSPSSAGSKKGNRRSIMLTSFVPPVGMSGGGSSTGSTSRSSTESPAGSINESDPSALNGVVEISAGGKAFKRTSILDSQVPSSRRSSNRISQEMGMSSIRLRPSAEIASGSLQSDVKSVAKTALQSISEKIGGNSSAKDPASSNEDDGMPEWMKEVQRRKREAREEEEAARAAAAAAMAEESEEVSPASAATPEPIAQAPAPAPTVAAPRSAEPADSEKASHRHNGKNGNGKNGNGRNGGGSDDDDDTPLTEIDLGKKSDVPAPGAASNKDKPLPVPTAVSAPAPSAPGPVPLQQQPGQTGRSFYRSLSASLGISQVPQETAGEPARQSGPPMPSVPERQRSSSQVAASSPTPSQNGIFAAVTSFFGRASTQQSAPPQLSGASSEILSTVSSSSNMSRNTVEFPGMRPSHSEPIVENSSSEMDMLLHQLEVQNQQILKDNKARVFAQGNAAAVEDTPGTDADDIDWDFWGNLINNYDRVTRAEPRKLARSVYKGVPKAIRGTVWQQMARSRQDPDLGKQYHKLVARKAKPGSEDAKHEKQIRHDLARTFPKLDYFRDADGAGQEGLFSVLRAYAMFDPEVGYCQGLSFVVGPLLMNMPDEEAFCLLVKLMYTYGLRGHFLPTMDDLQLRLYQFEHVLHESLPYLARHFEEQGVQATMYVSQWLMTMFAYRLPIELTFRLFDVIFAEGLDCLLRVAVAVLKRSQTRLLTLEFEAILKYLNDGPLFAFYSHASQDMLVRDANHITSVNGRTLQKLRQQYIDEIQQRIDEEDEANQIRSQNEQLKQDCEKLRETLKEMSAKQNDAVYSRRSLESDLERQREENHALAAQIKELEERLQNTRPSADSQSKEEADKLAQKNVQLSIKNRQLEDSLQDLEDALVQIKTLYAESETQRELMTTKFEDLRNALK